MHFRIYTDVKQFYQDTYPVFMLHEAQNVIPLGNLIMGNEGVDKIGWRDPVKWFMATVADDAGIRIAAMMTPPYKITLYATNNNCDESALQCLINGIKNAGVQPPGVMTDKDLAERFAMAYTGGNYKVACSQRIYELLQVSAGIPSIGKLRLAKESDMAFLPYWCEGFHSDCFFTSFTVPADEEGGRYEIASGHMYILEDNGTPVSMTKITRELQSTCGVGYVYTPPYFRGRGYATSCVAAVSRLALEKGFTRCVLYTDLANPTSNNIYQKIGYTPIGDSLDIEFC